jgi:hypothetical protein
VSYCRIFAPCRASATYGGLFNCNGLGGGASFRQSIYV